jgi:hypothetical protein
MSAPPLATADDAVTYGYTLPDDTADTWLARASVRVRRAAGWDINSTTSTFRTAAEYDEVALPSPPVTDVASVSSIARDGTVAALTQGRDWYWDGAERVVLLVHAERVEVVYTHGFVTIPDSLVELVCSVAQRLSNTPVGMEAGIRSVAIDDYSRTFAAEARTDAASLLPGEQDALDGILAVPTVWLVRSR